MKALTLFFLISISLPIPAFANKVIRVIDGDTLVVETSDKEEITVRLAEIDAPEIRQEFGVQSKEMLEKICLKKSAVLKDKSKDRYERTVARLYCDKVDVSAEMVKEGMAWPYLKYVKDERLIDLQKAAQDEYKGLWSTSDPLAPWSFRQLSRQNR